MAYAAFEPARYAMGDAWRRAAATRAGDGGGKAMGTAKRRTAIRCCSPR
jgi:hypothetical protein